MSNTIIKKTFYSEYFDEKIENIYLLDEDEASKLWSDKIDKSSNNFYKINDDNPIIYNSKNIGDWKNYYDSNNILGLQKFLKSILNWEKDELVFFCINKNTIITTLYHVFLENICNFLELYDDCPILISHEKLECIYFTPLGNTFYSSYKI
ncbi:DUF2947 family protein [Elizabethkingia anophelis]|uniref:DUF2947 family protein n=1 Tax=Elizabethkingia anophelis TaxID=1117645 RepID=UPI00136B4136|nr:DUF2947 family protein [Elizabethkingia anophelis]MYZ61809.1 DUF2947 family protein [Elizabethkingia anophelis]